MVWIRVDVDLEDIFDEVEDSYLMEELDKRNLQTLELEQLKMLVQMNKPDDVFQLIRTYINNRFGTAY